MTDEVDFDKTMKMCYEEIIKIHGEASAYESTIQSLVEEGMRIGKNPWCACIYCENEAYYRIQGRLYIVVEQETMEQTLARRKAENDEYNEMMQIQAEAEADERAKAEAEWKAEQDRERQYEYEHGYDGSGEY